MIAISARDSHTAHVSCTRRTALLLLGVALSPACRIPPADTEVRPDVVLTPPELEDVALTCLPDEEVWELEVTATSWTSGGILSWTVDGDWLEQHVVRSVEAAPDGTSDRLRIRLAMVIDPAYQAPASSTLFRCPDLPTAQFDVYDLDGNRTDCLRWGPQPELLDTDGVSSCASS